MNARRVWLLARRVIQQIRRDRRVIALLVFIPMLVLTLGAILFRARPSPSRSGWSTWTGGRHCLPG